MIRLRVIIFVSALLVNGCANPSVNTVRETKTAPTYNTPPVKLIPEQPKKDPDAYRASDSGKTYSLSITTADIKEVLMLLSKESGIPIVAERGIVGNVRVEAQNKKLGELLYAIIKPLGYTASVENGVISIGKPRLATRTFRVNYIKDMRTTKSDMNIKASSASGSSGSVTVSTDGKSDFWGTLENALEMMVFGSSVAGGSSRSGGYTRGEAEKKDVALQEKHSSGQAGGQYSEQERMAGKSPKISSGKFSSTSSINQSTRTTFQTTEVEDPQLLNTQIVDNKLKQLIVNEIAGIIQITDYPENLDRIAAFLADVEEGSKRQVMIQTHIMEVNLKDSFSLGIDWKYILDKTSNLTLAQALVPTSPTNVFKISAAGDKFGVLVDAMKEQGNVNMLSSPKITALNSQKAVIKLTTKQVSWVSSKTTQNNAIGGQDTYTTTPQIDEVGIFLDVTPQIGADNTITMQIHPSVSEIKEMSTSPDKNSTAPIIDVREIDTMVDAKAGETIVIAGLITDKLNETKRSVPLLGDIPYLGGIFSYNKQERTKAELVIMMTPYILNAKSIDEIRADHEQRMQNMGGTFHLINNLGSLVTEKRSRDWMMNSELHRNRPTTILENRPLPKNSDIMPSLPQTVTPAAAPAAPPPVEKTAPPPPEAKRAAEPLQSSAAITPPETVRRLEQQQATIIRLENEALEAQQRLKRERQEREARSDEERKTAELSRLLQARKIEELQNRAFQESSSRQQPLPAPVQALPETKAPVASVQTVSVTSDQEQILYRSAVTAYKIGDCTTSITAFDAFIQTYPNSPFITDAAFYRQDCFEKQALSGK